MGTGIRGSSFWGKRLVDQYSDIFEFVGLSDINPGRLESVKSWRFLLWKFCLQKSHIAELARQNIQES